jgi:hypothetical protein
MAQAMNYAALFVAIIVMVIQPLGSHAQEAEIALLSKGTWVIDSVTSPHSPYWRRKLISGQDDSTFYQFKATGSHAPDGYPKMHWFGEQAWGYIEDPVSGRMVPVRISCRSFYGFLGKNRDSSSNILVVGEHWPYVATLHMTSESTFMLTAIFDSGEYSTKYFRRIPTPGFLRK